MHHNIKHNQNQNPSGHPNRFHTASQHRTRRGITLILVLWAVVILSIVIVNLAQTTKLDHQIFNYAGEKITARWIARAAAHQALAIVADADPAVTNRSQTWFNAPELCRQHLPGGHFTLLTDDSQDRTEKHYLYGLRDEAAKLHPLYLPRDVLLQIPEMTDVYADALMNNRPAQTDNLTALAAADNKPANVIATALPTLRSIADLITADTKILVGEDTNLNAILDNNEDDGDLLPPNDNKDHRLDPGILSYLTVYSFTYNRTADNSSRLNINKASIIEMQAELDLALPYAKWIVENRGAGFDSVADILADNAAITLDNDPALQGRAAPDTAPMLRKLSAVDLQQLLLQTPSIQPTFSVFHRIVDRITVTDSDVLSGRVNVNTAPVNILRCLPGITEKIADAVIAYRDNYPNGFTNLADLLLVQELDIRTFKPLARYLTTRSNVFSFYARGVTSQTRAAHTIQAVIARTDTGPVVLYWHESF